MKKVLSLIMVLAMVLCMCPVSFVFASQPGATQQPGDIEIEIGGGSGSGNTTGTQGNPLIVMVNTTIRVAAGKTYYIIVSGNSGMTLSITGATGFTVNNTADTQGVYTAAVKGNDVAYTIVNKTGVEQTYKIKLDVQRTVKFSTPTGVTKIQDMTSGLAGIVLPAAGAPKGYTFVGWVTQVVEDTDVAPKVSVAGSRYIAAENVTLIALYSYMLPSGNTLYYTTKNFFDHQWDEGVVSGNQITYTCGSCGSTKMESIGVPGDCNGDGEVNNEDVIHLLWHTLFSDTYQLATDADFVRDGQINNEDVIYLLWHTLFPDTYPLT